MVLLGATRQPARRAARSGKRHRRARAGRAGPGGGDELLAQGIAVGGRHGARSEGSGVHWPQDCAPMAADRELVEHCRELLAPLGAVRVKRMFGGHGFYVDEIFMALIAFGRLYLRWTRRPDVGALPRRPAASPSSMTAGQAGRLSRAGLLHRVPDEGDGVARAHDATLNGWRWKQRCAPGRRRNAGSSLPGRGAERVAASAAPPLRRAARTPPPPRRHCNVRKATRRCRAPGRHVVPGPQVLVSQDAATQHGQFAQPAPTDRRAPPAGRDSFEACAFIINPSNYAMMIGASPRQIQ